MKREIQSIGRDAALALAESKWWEKRTPREIAQFQMLTCELCVPLDILYKALKETLGRQVFTHEFYKPHLMAELFDDGPSPTFDEILELIPEEKRIVIGKEKP